MKLRSATPQKICLTLKFPEQDQESFLPYYEELQAEKLALSIVKRAKDVKKGKQILNYNASNFFFFTYFIDISEEDCATETEFTVHVKRPDDKPLIGDCLRLLVVCESKLEIFNKFTGDVLEEVGAGDKVIACSLTDFQYFE